MMTSTDGPNALTSWGKRGAVCDGQSTVAGQGGLDVEGFANVGESRSSGLSRQADLVLGEGDGRISLHVGLGDLSVRAFQ